MKALGRGCVPIWLNEQPHCRQPVNGTNDRFRAGSLNICKTGIAALLTHVFPFFWIPVLRPANGETALNRQSYALSDGC
jgi:hypothetical protein